IVWASPVTAGDEPVQVHIGLDPQENGEIDYEVYLEKGEGDTFCSQGTIEVQAGLEAASVDLTALKAACKGRTLPSAECYEAFAASGLEYGKGHQGLDTVYTGDGQVLAKLSLPAILAETQQDYMLHPCLLDSALQA
ncbi:polyketide synthase dehydratase domain-containing protein, partial [Acinetobacter sp. AGC35]